MATYSVPEPKFYYRICISWLNNCVYGNSIFFSKVKSCRSEGSRRWKLHLQVSESIFVSSKLIKYQKKCTQMKAILSLSCLWPFIFFKIRHTVRTWFVESGRIDLHYSKCPSCSLKKTLIFDIFTNNGLEVKCKV